MNYGRLIPIGFGFGTNEMSLYQKQHKAIVSFLYPIGITLSYHPTLKLWSVDGQELHTLTGHNDEVRSVSFSPGGKTIASASRDKSVILRKLDLDKWEMLSKSDLDELLVRGCSWVRDFLKTNANVSESDRLISNPIVPLVATFARDIHERTAHTPG